MRKSKPGVLFLVENVPIELDSRVRRETATLIDAGYDVSLICSGERGQPRREVRDGLHIFRYVRREPEEPSIGGHLAEYLLALVAQMRLSVLVLSKRGFDVVHTANPPDLLWLVAAPYKLLGKRVIFDQHDLVPELFEIRYGNRFRRLARAVAAAEWISYRTADHVIAINETCRQIALGRGRVAPRAVTIVRNGPRLNVDFPRVEPDVRIRRSGKVVVGYLGIMNDQDNLDVFLRMAHTIRFGRARDDIAFVMVGSGGAFERLRQLRDELGLREAVDMTGTIPWDQVLRTFAATDICVQPDLPDVLNSKLTMNKLMEYMAFGKPIVAFDMTETRISGGEGGVYVSQHDADGLAAAVIELADDPDRRARLGQAGRKRIEDELAWEHQARNLLGAYRQTLGSRAGAHA